MTILPLTYLGSVEWFSRLAAGGCVIDIGEWWVKQTARNRCEIMTPGGVAALSVPVHAGGKLATRDVRIDSSKRWQHEHWRSLVSAYRNSPFFDHFQERFAPIYDTSRKIDFLVDLNLELLSILSPILGISQLPEISETYVAAAPGDTDLRGKKALRRPDNAAFPLPSLTSVSVSACAQDSGFRPYTQVFSDRIEFVGGLSVVDLIFCEGPAARQFLRR